MMIRHQHSMSSSLICFLGFMLTGVLGRVPGAYNGNILRATSPSPALANPQLQARYAFNESAPVYINFTVYNNFPSNNVHMWVTGNDLATGDVVMLLPNSTWYFPEVPEGVVGYQIDNSVAIPLPSIGNEINIPLPGYLSSARVFFADGILNFSAVLDGNGRPAVQQPTAGIKPTDPAYDVNWGYMELSYGPEQTGNVTTGTIAYVDVTEVDFTGLPVGFTLYGCGTVEQVPGVYSNAVEEMCTALRDPPNDPSIPYAPWNETCILNSTGSPIRVVAPGSIGNDRFDDYWAAYVDAVWEYYTINTLQLLGDYATPLANCTVVQDVLNCTGFNRGFTRPTATDIFGCSTGPFEGLTTDNYDVLVGLPIVCAAFNRGTFLLSGGDIQPQQPPSVYYTNDPSINNFYSHLVHTNAYDSLGYAFPYDDVTPADEINQSGTLVDRSPLRLAMTVGGPVESLIPAKTLSGIDCPTYAAGAASGSGSGSSGSSGSKVFTYNPVTVNPTCTIQPSSTGPYVPPTPSPTVLGYSYLGCWTDSASNRTLQNAMESYDMTLEHCAGNATYNGRAIFGVEYTYQCWADNVVNTNSSCPALETDCNLLCDGSNGTQTCGGANRINLYQIIPTQTSTTSAASSTSASVSKSSTFESTASLTAPSASSTSSVTSSSTTISVTRLTSFSTTMTSMSASIGSSTVPSGATSNAVSSSLSSPSGSPSTPLGSTPAIVTTSTEAIATSSSTPGTSGTSTLPTSTSTQTPLPTSTGTPQCDTIFLNPDNTTYRIYCNATITGNNLAAQSPFTSFLDCIALCASQTYNNTCIGSVFTNSTATTSCVLKSNASMQTMTKRDDDDQVIFQRQAFAAYRLLDPGNDQGPAAPVDPDTVSSSSTSSVSPSQTPSASTSTATTTTTTNSSGDLLTAISPSMSPSPPIPFLPGQGQGQGQGVCTAARRKSVTVVALVTVTTCPSPPSSSPSSCA